MTPHPRHTTKRSAQLFLTVGQLAKRGGTTIKRLHHYDALGLIKPSKRTRAGYRLYNSSDAARLQVIHALKELGFPLNRIKDMLARRNFSLEQELQMHIATLKRRLFLETKLCADLRKTPLPHNGARRSIAAALIKLRRINGRDKRFGRWQHERT